MYLFKCQKGKIKLQADLVANILVEMFLFPHLTNDETIFNCNNEKKSFPLFDFYNYYSPRCYLFESKLKRNYHIRQCKWDIISSVCEFLFSFRKMCCRNICVMETITDCGGRWKNKVFYYYR